MREACGAPRRRRGGHAGRRVLRRVSDRAGCARGRRRDDATALASGPDPGADGHAHGDAAADRRGLRRGGRAPGGADRGGRARRAGARLAPRRRRSSRPRLRDLGEHRLKDLSAPERIYQLGDGDFPPLKSLHQTNLPVPATPFLGRERELAEVRRAACAGRRAPADADRAGRDRQDAARAAGRRRARRATIPDGVWWVPLAPLRDPRARRADGRRRRSAREATLARAHRRQAAAARARQLRAGGRGGRRLADAARRVPRPRAARDEPRAAAHHRRAGVRGAAARARGGGRALPRARARGRRPTSRPTTSSRRDLPPPRRSAARARARRRAGEGALVRADPRAARAAAAAAHRRRARPARAPAHAAGDDRVELRAARRPRSSDCSRGSPSSRRLHARSGRGGRATPTSTRSQSLVDKSLVRHTGEPLLDARDDPRVRRRTPGESPAIKGRRKETCEALPRACCFREPLARHSGRAAFDLAIAEESNFRAALRWTQAHDEIELGLELAVALDYFWVTNHPQEGARCVATSSRRTERSRRCDFEPGWGTERLPCVRHERGDVAVSRRARSREGARRRARNGDDVPRAGAIAYENDEFDDANGSSRRAIWRTGGRDRPPSR